MTYSLSKGGYCQAHSSASGNLGDEAAKLLDWILRLLKATLQAGKPITIKGFGKFAVRSKRARQGRNPRRGKAAIISARRVVTFQTSLMLEAEVNTNQRSER